MPSLITPEDLRNHGVQTPITDAALQQIIDAEEAEIVMRYGALDSASQDYVGHGDHIVLGRKAISITEVVEYDARNEPLTLDPADYALIQGGWAVQRLATGPNPNSVFGRRARVIYVPESDTSQRKLVLINLCKLALAYTGYATVRTPDGQLTSQQYNAERNRLLRSLQRGLVIA